MSSLSHPQNLGNAPRSLAAWLLDADYSQHARERIVAYTIREGTPTGCPELDPADEWVAEGVFVEALPAVPQTSAEWCDPMEWTLPDDVLEAMSAHEEEEWCFPPRRQISPGELSQRAAHGCV
jgi:hypothetical protein